MKLPSAFIFSFFIPSYLFAQVEMSLHLDKGRTYSLSTSNKTIIIESTGEAETRTVSTEKGGHNYTLLEDLDSLYLMQVEFNHLSLKVETKENTVFYSSDINNHADVMSTLLNRIINKPFRVLMRKDFTWKEMQGLDSIFLQSYSDYNLTEDVRRQVDKAILESMKGFTRQDASLSAVMYGAKKIKPDEVWTSHFITEHVVPTTDSCTYQLSEITGDLLLVKGTGTVSTLEDEKVNEGISVSYHLNGTTNLSAKFFKNSCWIFDAVLRTEMTGNAAIKDTPSSEKKIVPMRIITEGTISGF